MSLDASAFISPDGNITGDMFPDDVDLEERAQGYLDALSSIIGSTLTGDKLDSALYYGVYVRFYEAAAAIAIAQPTQGTLVDQASVQWATNRSDQYLKLAAKYQAMYNGVFATDTPPPSKYPSGAVPTRVTAP